MSTRDTSGDSIVDSESTRGPNILLGLLPFAGVVLFVIAMIIVVATGTDDLLQTATMMAVLFLVGSSAIGNGIAHLFFGPTIARSIGWQPGPFQFEVGAANLGIGIAGVIVGAFFGPDAWLGVIIVDLVFLVLAGAGHIREIVKEKNLSINNAGPILVLDFVLPLFTLALWVWLAVS